MRHDRPALAASGVRPTPTKANARPAGSECRSRGGPAAANDGTDVASAPSRPPASKEQDIAVPLPNQAEHPPTPVTPRRRRKPFVL